MREDVRARLERFAACQDPAVVLDSGALADLDEAVTAIRRPAEATPAGRGRISAYPHIELARGKV